MSERSPTLKPEAADSGGAQTGGTEPKRILLVEGDGFTRLVLLLRLRLAGFGVDFTSNGTLGLGKLRSCQPDILVVELKDDDDTSDENKAKFRSATEHFEAVNLLQADLKYHVKFISPRSYDAFFQAVQDGSAAVFVSALQVQLER